MLNSYRAQTRRLLQNPPAPNALYSADDLKSYINTARGQLAGESECVRVLGTLALAASTRVYAFSTIVVSSVAGVGGVFNIKQASVVVGGGQTLLYARSFVWFNSYLLNEVVPASGVPTTYAQYGQGKTGSLYVYPLPSDTFSLNVDCACVPIDLVDDSTAEAIPFPWTDCVPYFAAYMALMSAQRQQDAEVMLKRYTEFVGRARRMSTPTVLPFQHPQAADLTRTNKLGLGGERRQ